MRQYYLDFAEAFQIFSKYKEGSVAAEHDKIYAGCSPDMVFSDDLERLEELGWSPDEQFDCFYTFV